MEKRNDCLHSWPTKARRTHSASCIFAAVCVCAWLSVTLSGCRNTHFGSDERTEQEDSLLRQVSDSLEHQTPHSKDMVARCMREAKDSLTYYEYYVRTGIVWYLTSQPDSLAKCVNNTLRYAFALPEKTPRVNSLIALAYETRSNYFQHFRMQLDSLTRYHKLAYDYMLKGDTPSGLPDVCANLADVYEQKNNIPQAAYWYRRALFLSDSLHLPQSVNLSLYMGLARVYMVLRDYNSAQHYYEATERQMSELTPNMQSYFLNDYGNLFYYKKDYPRALTLFRRLKAMLSNGHKEDFDMYLCYLNMADVFLNLNRADSATFYLDKAEPYFVKTKVSPAIYYVNTIRIGLALKAGDVARAKAILDGEKVPAPTEPGIVSIRNGYLRDFYVKTGDYRKAYYNLLSSNLQNDSLEHNKSHMRAEEIIMRFQQDTLALHKKINIEEKDKEVRDMYGAFLGSLALLVVIVLAAVAFFLYNRKRKLQDQIDMLQLRMANARNRISPHFIFNVLNHEVNKRDEKGAQELGLLIKLLRASLDISRNAYIDMKTEMDFVTQYVNTEQYVLGDDFDFSVELPSDDVMRLILIPSMFVQILAENAIKHGLMEKEGHKTLFIKVDCLPDRTDIFVRDNGVGFDINRSNSSSTKTGLNVIRQSIMIINENNKHKMHFSIHNLTDEAGNIVGCEAVLNVPSDMKLTGTNDVYARKS
jgi:tetratricopeptide (TPR) repeat protein